MSTITIESLLGGISQIQNFSAKGSFNSSIAIDPDMPNSDVVGKPSGYIRPTAMEKFSGSTVTSAPKWIITNPKTSDIYLYGSNGLVHKANSSLAMQSDVGTPTSGAGNGGAYYDNYTYLATPTDISRLGPMNGTPSITNTYWSSTLSKAVLTNTTYPTINGVVMPNHVMHRHTDNKLYICDVLSNTAGNTNKGSLHYIYSTKTTVEGDTNIASSYNALDLGYGYYPTTIESYGTELVTAGIEGVDTITAQSRAFLTFWDATSTSFQKLIQVEFPDPLITALKNVNGALYVWSGSATGGCRLTVFLGGYSFQEVFYDPTMYPPLQGAVDAEHNRVIWGTSISYPETASVVMAFGSRYEAMGKGVQCILKSTASTGGMITSLKYATQGGFRAPIVGWTDNSASGLDKLSTTYGTWVYRSELFRMGRPFEIDKIRIPLAQALGSNMSFTVKAFIDENPIGADIQTVNSTNYPNGERNIVLYPQGIKGTHSIMVELRGTGTALCTVALPISIEYTPLQD